MRWLLKLAAGTFLATLAIAEPVSPRTANKRFVEERNGINYNVFEHVETRSKLAYVKNSGICETTPGVNQYSGYISVGENMNMWFWYFEARENATTAPLVAYVDGGPGAASEYGLFTQIGPCHFVNNETGPSLNPYSFNNYANVLFIDQPIGVGFSYGNETINSTVAAAEPVWTLLQAFYAGFPEYENRDFFLFSESYGGHYGPEFVQYIVDQNQQVAGGHSDAQEICLVGLGVHNGWFDAEIQEKYNIEYMYNNTYRQIINESYHDELLGVYDDTVKPALDRCRFKGTIDDCFAGYNSYMNGIEYPLLAELNDKSSNYYLGDIREPSLRPPSTHVGYLQRADIQKAIGAQVNYTDQRGVAGFIYSGDDARSFLDDLSKIVQQNIPVLIWTGDADYVSNWYGTLAVADALEWKNKEAFVNRTLVPYTLNGVEKGTFKVQDNLIYMRIYEAGHNLPFYRKLNIT
ncbi:putative carboxypeptidase S1 [Jackrogersella minutella]|nr:putative carboxypeptidase S1 [Jackrogersella minutella]